jgi:putative transposase
MKLSRTVFHYRRRRANKDKEIEEALMRLAAMHPEMGFGKFFAMLRREGKGWNHKRVYRVYCGMKLN